MAANGSAGRAAFIRAAPLLLLVAVAGCTSTSQEVTGPGNVAKCSATVAASPQEFSAQGGEGRITVTTGRDCRWDIREDAAWLTVTAPADMQGSGAATFVVAATTDPLARTATVVAANQQITITQRAAACQYKLSHLDLSVPSTGGGADVDVTASSAQCEWTAQSAADWVTIRTGQRYKGNARVTVEAPAWTGPPRRAEIAVADQRVALTQSDGCAFTLASSSASIPRTGGHAAVSVQTGSGCGWSATSGVPWVTITAGATASGPGTVEFSVDPNSGPLRSTQLMIANRGFTITQAAGCEYRLDPAAANFAAAGGSGTFAMNAPAGCAWTAASDAPWLTVTSGQSGSGPGTVQMSVSVNAGPQRTAGVSAGGQRFVATQASGCTYTINPSGWGFSAQPSADWIYVTTTPDCPWTATSNVSWMSVNAGQSGTGSGIVYYSLTGNPSGARSGTLTVAGQTFTAFQAGGN